MTTPYWIALLTLAGFLLQALGIVTTLDEVIARDRRFRTMFAELNKPAHLRIYSFLVTTDPALPALADPSAAVDEQLLALKVHLDEMYTRLSDRIVAESDHRRDAENRLATTAAERYSELLNTIMGMLEVPRAAYWGIAAVVAGMGLQTWAGLLALP